MRHELDDLQANKLHLQGHMEAETARLSTTTLLDEAQQRCNVGQKSLEKSRKKYLQLEVILVEAKEIMLRVEKAAQPLASLAPLLPKAQYALDDDTVDDTNGLRQTQEPTSKQLALHASDSQGASSLALWDISTLQIMEKLESTAQLLCVHALSLVCTSRNQCQGYYVRSTASSVVVGLVAASSGFP